MDRPESVKWPFEGRFTPAHSKDFAATVVFVHNYGGTHASSLRHRDWLAKMGFDSFAFNLEWNDKPNSENGWMKPYAERLKSAMREGLLEHWSKQLEIVLEMIDGPKIIYSFSFPSASVLHLLSRGRPDVKAWICDGGPFDQLFTCLWNYFTFEAPVRNRAARFALTELSHLYFGGFTYMPRVRSWMEKAPSIPVLSIRAGSDKLVPAEAIDGFFASNRSLQLQKVVIPSVGHLEGLKRSEDLYKQYVGEFLRGIDA